MKRLSLFFVAILSVVSINASAQSWSGWRFDFKPGATWLFGNSREVAETWRHYQSIRVDGDLITLNYGTNYYPVLVKSGANLSWLANLEHRGLKSSTTYGFRIWILNSNALAEGEALNPPRANYTESCRVFSQVHLPLANEDRPSGLALINCGGENLTKFFDLGAFIEKAVYESAGGGLYGTLSLGYRQFSNKDHIWMKETVVIHGYFGPGEDFVNFISLNSYSRATARLFGPALGLRVALLRNRFSFEASFEQSIRLGVFVIDSTIWTDEDETHSRNVQGLGPTIGYFSGRFPRNSVLEGAVVFGNELNFRGTYRLNSSLLFGLSAFCSNLGNLPMPARWEVPADWNFFQGTGWQGSERRNLVACGIFPTVRFTL